MAGGFFAFLLLPLLCDLPMHWGPVAGLAFFMFQLAFGERLIVKLLRWEETPAQSLSPECERSVAYRMIASDCPMVLSLSGLTWTRGAAGSGVTPEMIAEWQTMVLSSWETAYLCRLLAVPCLLRAFEAVTDSYGRLRLSEGPLWYLGRFLGAAARVLEWPLRLCWGEARAECRLKFVLMEALPKQGKLPAWVRALDLLSPISVAEVKRRRRLELLGLAVDKCELAGADGQGTPPERCCFKGAALCLGMVLALSPWQFWGALPLGAGLELAFWFNRHWPRYKGICVCDGKTLVSLLQRKATAVCWKGKLTPCPEEMALERVPMLFHTDDGRALAVSKAPVSVLKWDAEGTEIEICGWFDGQNLMLQADRLRCGTRSWNNHFRGKFALWPWLLAASGSAWWYLQCAGL